ncbi:DUF5693 family protein [Caldibacillus lycopersici]|uniref:DUF5693 family protein n=1 Tax=Perspicuibacillus lycopersici TaxID=1325689 RepID=A0AAE3LQA1_9BACI|nr:DUF5693 family protein [Perspicuibacillus lycopersici]MCU9613254.1 DUF5693 family protein [Perspicuibacillus lycopersici]
MKGQNWIWVVVVLLLLGSLPGIVTRWNAEAGNNTYEIAMPFEEIMELTETGPMTIEAALSTLATAGLNSISLEPVSLEQLDERGVVAVYNKHDLERALLFSGKTFDAADGYYITVPDDTEYRQWLEGSLSPETVQIEDTSFYFIPQGDFDWSAPIGYDPVALRHIQDYGLHTIFRMENLDLQTNQQLVDQLVSMKTPQANGVLFSKEEVIGYPKPDEISDFTNTLHDAGYYFYLIEFSEQKGMQTLGRSNDYDVLRLHSIDLGKKTLNETISQAVRAVKERSIQSIFVHLPQDEGTTASKLEDATSFIEGVHQAMPNEYAAGKPLLFEKITVSTSTLLCVFAAGILFTYLTAELVKSRLLQAVAFVMMLLLAISYFFTKSITFLQGFALIIACVTPIYAVLKTSRQTGKITTLTLRYLQAIGISAIGIMIVIGLLNGDGFMTGFEVFRGVKLVYVVPIVFVAIYVFWKESRELFQKHGFGVLNLEVRYWHVLVFLIVAAVGIYYIMRTGNSGAASALEIRVRNALEDFLYVRPRTKEFLIGFPCYLLALYIIGQGKDFGKLLLIPGVIGFLSIVNTFTHLHIPLSVSLLRTVYSIVLGYIVGLVFIFLWRQIFRWFVKNMHKKATIE